MTNKLTKNDIEKILPSLGKEEAIEQTERYREEYENSKKEFEEFMKKIKDTVNVDDN